MDSFNCFHLVVSVLRDVAATLSTPVMSAGLCVLRDVIATANSVMSAGLVYSVMSLTVYSVV